MSRVAEEELVACLPRAEYLASRFWSIPVDDAKAEAAVGLVKASKKFDPQAGVLFSTFATRVVRNHLLNVARRSVVYAPLPVCTEADAHYEADAAAHGDDECAKLRAAMATLTPQVRKALELRYGDTDALYSKIGEELGCSGQYARALVAAGLAKLRRLMA